MIRLFVDAGSSSSHLRMSARLVHISRSPVARSRSSILIVVAMPTPFALRNCPHVVGKLRTEIVGHANEEITNSIYTHVRSERVAAVAVDFDPLR